MMPPYDKARVTDMPFHRAMALVTHPRRRVRKKWQRTGIITRTLAERTTVELLTWLRVASENGFTFSKQGQRRLARALCKFGHQIMVLR